MSVEAELQLRGFQGVAFSTEERCALLEEIEAVCLLLGECEALLPFQSAKRQRASWLERIGILGRVGEILSEAVPHYLQRPLLEPLSQERRVPLVRSQGRKEAVQKLARLPLGGSLAEPETLQRVTLIEPLKQLSPDGRVLGLVARLLEAVETEAEALLSIARFCEAEREADRLQEVARTCQNLRQMPLLQEVKAVQGVAWEEGWQRASALRGGSRFTLLLQAFRLYDSGLWLSWEESPLLLLASQEPWRLYEIWAFLKVVAVLLALGWEREAGSSVRLTERGLRLELARGQESVLCFRSPDVDERLSLWYQPYFPSANQNRQGVCSQTHAMQPDIGLERGGRWLLLDPKCKAFREPQSEQDDINKMHAYRDAIVQNGRAVVEGAWCLFPGTPATSRVIAYPRRTESAPFGRAGVGAIQLRPCDSTARLSELIRLWVSTPTPLD